MNNNHRTYAISIQRFWRLVLLTVTCLLLPVGMWAEGEIEYAGITVADATLVDDTVQLYVRDGANYMKVESEHLPATFVYVPDSAFGPLPIATVMGDTMPATVLFSGCRMSWVWRVERPEDESAQLVSVITHEDATVYVYPLVCPGDADTIAEAWDSLMWAGIVYTESGDCVDSIITPEGCRYTNTLHLTIHKTLYQHTPEAVCDSLVLGGKTYAESGAYVLDTVALPNGDRQVNILDLTVSRSTTAEIVAEQFDSYTSPFGKIYTQSGTYMDTTTNVAGCDSVVTLHVTIHTTSYDTVRETACDSFTYNGITYTADGSYNDTTVLPNGDRVVNTLELTVNHSSSEELFITRCESYTSPMGKTYIQSGDYTEKGTNVAGCDSVMTIHLTISHATYGQITTEACVSYLAPSGKVYTESGVYEDTTTNAAGCDSIITLQLTIIPDCFEYEIVYFCRGLNTEHDEKVSDGLVRRYRAYTYESPDTWDYMAGVIVRTEGERTLVDTKRAEINLQAYYSDGLEPVTGVTWSYCPKGQATYQTLESQMQPQWIGSGVVAMQVSFLCGHTYRSSFATGTEAVEQTETELMPTKRLVNGQVVIIRGDATYTPLGQKIQ